MNIKIEKVNDYWYNHTLRIDGEIVACGGSWEVKENQLYLYDDEGSSGTGKRRGVLLRSIPLQGNVFEYINHNKYTYELDEKFKP